MYGGVTEGHGTSVRKGRLVVYMRGDSWGKVAGVKYGVNMEGGRWHRVMGRGRAVGE